MIHAIQNCRRSFAPTLGAELYRDVMLATSAVLERWRDRHPVGAAVAAQSA